MKLIVISPPNNHRNEQETLEKLFALDLEYFHLRKPGFPEEEYKKYLNLIPNQYLNRVVIHNHHQLIEKYPLKGIHYTHYTNNFKYLDPQFNFQRSKACHSLSEIPTNPSLYQYVFLSPIYDSISKQGYKSKFKLSEVKHFLKRKNKNPEVIALGGIELEKVDELKEIGFDGLAVLGTIWQENNLKKRLEKFQLIQEKIAK